MRGAGLAGCGKALAGLGEAFAYNVNALDGCGIALAGSGHIPAGTRVPCVVGLVPNLLFRFGTGGLEDLDYF